MRRLRLVVVAVSTVVLAGCTFTHTIEGRVSPPASAIQPARQLQSTTQLQSDLHAVNAAATEGDLLIAVNQLRQDYPAVAGTHANSDDALWQQTLTNLQQTLADVSQLAGANSSTPIAPNPLKSSASGTRATSAPTSPSKPPNPPSQIISELQNADNLLRKVVTDLAYVIVVKNGDQPGGTVTISNTDGGPYPAINCGVAEATCSGVVLALNTVGITFQPSPGGTAYQIGNIDSTPKGACNASYESQNHRPPAPHADCDVTATSGNTVTITPHWVPKP